ncbi:MAG: type II toxin-antitoxin system VapC family toxin [Proteobacteria bacterium]|nr:type II toxin-antitoxin system VapC family toxin [Pseudomonadota bacterium]
MKRIAIDTSAIVELLTLGPQSVSMREAVADASTILVTPVARVEAAFVLMGRFGWTRSEFDRAWSMLALSEVPVDSSLAARATDAFELWGKGRAEAGLNFGDCFSHALAAARNVPLLYIGDDFSKTDLQRTW